jgi:hypothetical protein
MSSIKSIEEIQRKRKRKMQGTHKQITKEINLKVEKLAHLQNLNLSLDLSHPDRTVDIALPNQLDGHFLAPRCMYPQLNLPKLSLSKRLQQQVRSKLGYRPPWVRGGVRYGCRVAVDVDRPGAPAATRTTRTGGRVVVVMVVLLLVVVVGLGRVGHDLVRGPMALLLGRRG